MTNSTNTKLLFLGDWYLTELVDATVAAGHIPFIFNLESSISGRGKPTPGKISLRMEENHILTSFGKKPLAVCLGNNHIMDYGNEALEDTLALLCSMNIPFFGAGRVEDNFHNPAIVHLAGQTVALLGYVSPSTHPIYAGNKQFGVCPIELGQIRRDIQQARERGATRVAVSLHWGAEELMLPKPGDVKLAHRIIDAGADALVGHHAHVTQPIEIYNKKPIAYGLGNFVMPDLAIPVYEDHHENSVYIFKKKQTFRNKLSLGLVWDVNSGAVKVKEFFFDGTKVKESNITRSSFKNPNMTAPYYPLRFNIHLRKRRLVGALGNYLANPQFPKPRHVASLYKILTQPRT